MRQGEFTTWPGDQIAGAAQGPPSGGSDHRRTGGKEGNPNSKVLAMHWDPRMGMANLGVGMLRYFLSHRVDQRGVVTVETLSFKICSIICV